MRIWYKRRVSDTTRAIETSNHAPVRRRRRRRLSSRWNQIPVVEEMPPYIPPPGERVLVRLRCGTVEQFEEVHGHVVGSCCVADRNYASVEVQNCTRKVRLSWHGFFWKCDFDRFYYEVDLKPEEAAATA